MMPKISVIMPVYNSENFIDNAVKSILDQTFSDFEFIIINDGSTDSTPDILSSYKDPRIHIHNNEHNIGYVLSLNKALEIAQGEYIARMDADDVSLPERFEYQVEYMDRNPGIGICGSFVKFTGSGKGNIWKPPCDHNDIICNQFFTSSLAHPSVMMRKKILDEHDIKYDHEYYGAEDFRLWVQLSRFTKLANINKVLLLYAKHDQQVSSVKRTTQLESANRVRYNQLVQFAGDANQDDISMHNLFGNRDIDEIILKKDRAIKWLEKLNNINRKSCHFPEPEFSYCTGKKARWVYNNSKSGVLNKLIKFSKISEIIHKKISQIKSNSFLYARK